MPRKAFVLCTALDLPAILVVCTVPDDSPQTLARRLRGKYREENGYALIDFSDIWETLPPLREDTPGLEDLVFDLRFDGEPLDQEHVLAVGIVNIALSEDQKLLFVIESPLQIFLQSSG